MVKYFKNLGILPFYTFSENLNQQITLSGAGWGIPATKITELDTAFNIYKPFFHAITNKLTRTPQQVDDHTEQRIIFENFVEPFANQYIIPNPAINNAQCEVLGFNRKQEPGTRPAITSAPVLGLKAAQGSRVEVENRVESDQTRPSRHKDCDGVEVRYIIAAASGGTAPPTPGSPSSPTPGAAAYTFKFSKKAKLTLQLAETDAGKVITMHSRWVNLTNNSKNGPWSLPATVMVTW
jgi:hypothetical protein